MSNRGIEKVTERAGDPHKEVLFRAREREYVYSVAMKYVKDEDAAADVTQDAMLLAYRNRASFRGDSRFTTWLYRVAATTALMHLRKKRRAPREIGMVARDESGEMHDVTADLVAEGATPEESAEAHEAVERAGVELERLGDKYGRIFRMRFADGYSEEEIARELKMNVATVKTRAYRARAALREALGSRLAG